MPILVQWKWKEQTKSFLVIFHFYDDFSKPNLRTKKRKFLKNEPIHASIPSRMLIPEDLMAIFEGQKSITTWAPSHIELGMLSELLRYANVIDGLSEAKKRELRRNLELIGEQDRHLTYDDDSLTKISEVLKNKMFVLGSEFGQNKVGYSLCVELCPEYFDYLKEILKPYLK